MRKFWPLFFVASLVLSSCTSDDPVPQRTPEVIRVEPLMVMPSISKDVVFVDQAYFPDDMVELIRTEELADKLIFHYSAMPHDIIQVGDVLNGKTGYLRRATAVQLIDDKTLEVETVEAGLEELLDGGTISWENEDVDEAVQNAANPKLAKIVKRSKQLANLRTASWFSDEFGKYCKSSLGHAFSLSFDTMMDWGFQGHFEKHAESEKLRAAHAVLTFQPRLDVGFDALVRGEVKCEFSEETNRVEAPIHLALGAVGAAAGRFIEINAFGSWKMNASARGRTDLVAPFAPKVTAGGTMIVGSRFESEEWRLQKGGRSSWCELVKKEHAIDAGRFVEQGKMCLISTTDFSIQADAGFGDDAPKSNVNLRLEAFTGPVIGLAGNAKVLTFKDEVFSTNVQFGPFVEVNAKVERCNGYPAHADEGWRWSSDASYGVRLLNQTKFQIPFVKTNLYSAREPLSEYYTNTVEAGEPLCKNVDKCEDLKTCSDCADRSDCGWCDGACKERDDCMGDQIIDAAECEMCERIATCSDCLSTNGCEFCAESDSCIQGGGECGGAAATELDECPMDVDPCSAYDGDCDQCASVAGCGMCAGTDRCVKSDSACGGEQRIIDINACYDCSGENNEDRCNVLSRCVFCDGMCLNNQYGRGYECQQSMN